MNTFINAVKNEVDNAVAYTSNGMKARKTTANGVLDFFTKSGSSRDLVLTGEFLAALAENEELAIRALLWTRDVRGGAGERKQFRELLKNLEIVNPTLAGRIIHKIPELGRWDDLFSYQDPINRKKALRMYADALMNGDGLAAKWAPREKSTKRKIAFELRNFMGMSPREYRKMLVGLTNVVESQMCAKEWDAINFSHVPSLASARYQKAFGRNAGEAYSAYLRELQKPQEERNEKVKINAGAVYPYDVVKSVSKGNAAVADEQWKALPNYIGDAKVLPMVDVSGSMNSPVASGLSAMTVAVSLGLYCSDKNTGPFKDMFLTFSANPKFVTVKGSLSSKMRQMQTADWGMNTNLQGAFEEILKVAKKNRVPAEDMPETLLILSDMQFDSANRSSSWGYRSGSFVPYGATAQEMIRGQYSKAGYKMPRIVFWNLNASYGRNNTPVKFNDYGVAMVSGFSPAIMKEVLNGDLENYTPYNVMVKTLMSDRYDY